VRQTRIEVALMLWLARMRAIQLRGPLTENGSVTNLKSNGQRTD